MNNHNKEWFVSTRKQTKKHDLCLRVVVYILTAQGWLNKM